MAEPIKGRKAFLTFNNPIEHGYNTRNPEDMKSVYFDPVIKKWNKIIFICCTKEIGKETHTEHDHVYIHFTSPVYRSSIQKLFPNADIRFHTESDEENRNYVFKTGKYEGTEKEETKIAGYQFEHGTVEKFRENQGKRNDLAELKEYILAGKSNGEIYDIDPNYMKHASQIDKIRLDLYSAKYKSEIRKQNVIYQCGATGSGKTRTVMEQYNYDVYRVTDYTHPFDSYTTQDVIIFEEFRSSLKIEQMLNLLDLYPVELPARYSNKQACYHTVYINSNWTLKEQYQNQQEEHPATWQAFLRRINEVHVYEAGKVYVYKQVKLEDGTYDFISDEGMSLFHEFD